MLKNNKAKLRALEPEDLKILYKWENDTSVWQCSNTYSPFSKYTLDKFLENAHLDIIEARQIRFVIETNDLQNNTPIGMIDLFEYDPMNNRAGVGITIGENNYRKKGYASSALELLIEYSTNILHLHQLFCNISSKNPNSISLFKKHGFVECGTKKEWLFNGSEFVDEIMLQKIFK